ncbi:M23 family metallopeptidase [Sphaerisporangium sp. TRM90804]|uniref:M23 family metallopeptidase n=1 Tax=Sphaerisporangium sp. TRM90804 TaxID=3031113 RepID=UPI002448CF5A|nr:M23 family metallopeptidase [Sphaerisporangium sp. TRM90804]MDH2430910.1 M23 family metallopeptidase [Sphaerisporangium sp. TRM90804]
MSRSAVLRAGITATLMAVFGLFVTATPAMAAPDLQLPFPCGQQWRLDTWAHAPALDMVKEPDQHGTDGATLVAPAAGTVNQSFYHSNAGNVIQINHGGRYYTTYLHLESRSLAVGAKVQMGTTIGRVGKTGPTSNGHPHLHFELGYDADNSGSATWGFAGSERVRPTFNGVTYGGGNNQTSRNVTSRNCPGPTGTASVYGVMSDGRLTYTAIDGASGRRTHGAVVSTATLGFTPKAMATLNFNTLLITEDGPEGKLYRVDVITNNTSLSFNPPIHLGNGYTHDLLAFDGTRLFGIADGNLRHYTINAAKPAITNISTGTTVGTGGFTLKTLTTTGANWILGTTQAGQLISYHINGATYTRHQLRDTTWQVFTNLLSPGAGVYYGHNSTTALNRYLDHNPHDGNADDLTGQTAVDTTGWTQTLLSAQPNTVR